MTSKATTDSEGHMHLLKNRYHWKAMKKSVYQHCTNCQVCAKHNIKTQQLKNEHFSSPPQPMEFIAMDLIGEFHPASSKGNRFALTAVCMLMGFILHPIEKQTCRRCNKSLYRPHMLYLRTIKKNPHRQRHRIQKQALD